MTALLDALLTGSSRSGGSGAGGDGTSIPLDRQIAALQQMSERAGAPCPFKRGDLVTVRPGMDVKGAGKPHVVIEVLDTPVIDLDSEPGSNRFLGRYTMRVAHYCGETMTQHAVDHTAFEAWNAAHEAAWQHRAGEEESTARKRLKSDVPLTEVARLLREEGRRISDAKITWKKGELVEITGHESSNAARPMHFGGRAIGLVETVDFSDETTRVVYFDDQGVRRTQWFKPVDLKPYAAVEPVPA